MPQFSRPLFVAIGVILSSTFVSGRLSQAAVTPDQVDKAIAKGVKLLYSLQQPGGQWETDAKRDGTEHNWEKMQGDTFGGFTSMATYALLAAGENPQDKRIVKAVDFLKKADVIGVYSIGLRCQVWFLIPQTAEVRALIKKDANALLNNVNSGKENKDTRGFWAYGSGKGGHLDHSVSQYGILGLWACQQSHAVEIGVDKWKLFESVWRDQQYPDGGWAYDGNGKDTSKEVTASMTAAGVATLFITQDYLHANEGLKCGGNITNKEIEAGLAWMDRNFGKVGNNCYTLYGVERIGVASGYKYFGNNDWYASGAELLVKSQKDDGSWDGNFVGATPLISTAYGLLFLSRGRAPVALSKLDYSVEPKQGAKLRAGNWNERPRDVANLVRWIGGETENFLNWQIVNLRAPVEDLHDAPILYISGNEELQLTEPDRAKLKLFVEQGGLILGSADCGKEAFSKSFESLGAKLFGGEFKDLPTSHPIYTREQFKANKWTRNRPKVRSLTNGVRELMILLPEADAGRHWQTVASQSQREIFELGANIFQYAVDKKNLRVKGQTYLVATDEKIKTDRSIKLARLQVGDNWNPEPGGWPRLAAILHNKHKIALTVAPVKPGEGKLSGYKIAHLTGTTQFQLNEAARFEIKDFIQNGGTLIIDSAGGAGPFADSADRELRALFPRVAEAALAAELPLESPVYQLPEAKVGKDDIRYRSFARDLLVGSIRGPRIHGITVGNRVAIFYSREDLSGGLVGQPMDGILGYEPSTATDLMRNMILYGAFGVPKTPVGTTKPAAAPAGK